MVDKVDILYNEIVGLRKDIKDILSQHNDRISILEEFKNKTLEVCIVISFVFAGIIDFIKSRVL